MHPTVAEPTAPFPASTHDHASCRDWILRRAESLCAEKKVRFTPQRREVLEILAASHRALGAYDILEHMHRVERRPPPAAVYRALEFLLALGVIHRMAGRNAYFACTRPEHGRGEIQFWICRRCGVVGETESVVIAGEVPRLAATLGFQVGAVNMEIEGECQACRGC
ncbi:MAG: transcriptional repressor [Magnetococcales bacterium]|nr:transcriptional repressor [Magnetococcales bacterium]